MTGNFDVTARHHQISFDRAFDSDSSSGGIQVTVDHFVFANRQPFLVAHLRRRSPRRHRQHSAEPREDQRQRRTAPDAPPEEHGSQSRQRHHRQHLEERHHGLPSFPHGALKNQQAQQVRSAESRLFQLLLPGLDISRIECVNSRGRQSENQSPNPLHRLARTFLKVRETRRKRLVFFQHRARQQPRFALQRP